MLQKTFLDFGFFGRFLTKKQPKLTKNEKNCQNPNRLMKFSEIWYVDASQQIKKLHFFFGFRPFSAIFNQKTATKKQKNRQNPNRLMKFTEIRYVEASQ